MPANPAPAASRTRSAKPTRGAEAVGAEDQRLVGVEDGHGRSVAPWSKRLTYSLIMALRPDLVGATGQPVEHAWTHDDTMLYAVAVGAGQHDPLEDLAFATENTEGAQPQRRSRRSPTSSPGAHGWPSATLRGDDVVIDRGLVELGAVRPG